MIKKQTNLYLTIISLMKNKLKIITKNFSQKTNKQIKNLFRSSERTQ